MAIFGSKIYPKDRGGHCTNDKRKYDDDIGQGRSGSCSRKRMMVLTWTGKRWADRVQLQLSRFAPLSTNSRMVCHRLLCAAGAQLSRVGFSSQRTIIPSPRAERVCLSSCCMLAGKGEGEKSWESQNIFTLLAASYSWPQGNNATRCFFSIWRRVWSHFSVDATHSFHQGCLARQVSEWRKF